METDTMQVHMVNKQYILFKTHANPKNETATLQRRTTRLI